jgi:hypothetical protein
MAGRLARARAAWANDPGSDDRDADARDQVWVIESGFCAVSVGVDPSSVELLLLHARGTSATATPRSTHNMKLEIRRM